MSIHSCRRCESSFPRLGYILGPTMQQSAPLHGERDANTYSNERKCTSPNKGCCRISIICEFRDLIRVALDLQGEKLCPFQNFVPSTIVMGHLVKTNSSNSIVEGFQRAATVKKLLCRRSKLCAVSCNRILGGISNYGESDVVELAGRGFMSADFFGLGRPRDLHAVFLGS